MIDVFLCVCVCVQLGAALCWPLFSLSTGGAPGQKDTVGKEDKWEGGSEEKKERAIVWDGDVQSEEDQMLLEFNMTDYLQLTLSGLTCIS